jgi:hypothetical protein
MILVHSNNNEYIKGRFSHISAFINDGDSQTPKKQSPSMQHLKRKERGKNSSPKTLNVSSNNDNDGNGNDDDDLNEKRGKPTLTSTMFDSLSSTSSNIVETSATRGDCVICWSSPMENPVTMCHGLHWICMECAAKACITNYSFGLEFKLRYDRLHYDINVKIDSSIASRDGQMTMIGSCPVCKGRHPSGFVETMQASYVKDTYPALLYNRVLCPFKCGQELKYLDMMAHWKLLAPKTTSRHRSTTNTSSRTRQGTQQEQGLNVTSSSQQGNVSSPSPPPPPQSAKPCHGLYITCKECQQGVASVQPGRVTFDMIESVAREHKVECTGFVCPFCIPLSLITTRTTTTTTLDLTDDGEMPLGDSAPDDRIKTNQEAQQPRKWTQKLLWRHIQLEHEDEISKATTQPQIGSGSGSRSDGSGSGSGSGSRSGEMSSLENNSSSTQGSTMQYSRVFNVDEVPAPIRALMAGFLRS